MCYEILMRHVRVRTFKAMRELARRVGFGLLSVFEYFNKLP
jgi:hypothetical protein